MVVSIPGAELSQADPPVDKLHALAFELSQKIDELEAERKRLELRWRYAQAAIGPLRNRVRELRKQREGLVAAIAGTAGPGGGDLHTLARDLARKLDELEAARKPFEAEKRDASSRLRPIRDRVRELRHERKHLIAAIAQAADSPWGLSEDEQLQQGRARCAGCRHRLRLRHDADSWEPMAWSEATRPDGGTAYWCKPCAEQIQAEAMHS